MIGLAEALDTVRRATPVNGPLEVPLASGLGWVLAETVCAVQPAPPHDKSMVDGYAVRADDLTTGRGVLSQVEQILAGQVPERTLQPGETAKIMTGAPLPAGADAVVMVEHTEVDADDPLRVRFATTPVRTGQHRMLRGQIWQAGQTLLTAGRCLRPIELGVLAEAGRARVSIVRPPRVALFQTGDELVSGDQEPAPGQIRNSNGPLLASLLRRQQFDVTDGGIVADDRTALTRAVHTGLAADVLVCSGGVSRGDRDYVPEVLCAAGVETHFHRVDMKPGQPLWFGTYHHDDRVTLVFGLPGNPVSGLVCALLFVLPALAARAGRPANWTGWSRHGVLAEPFTLRGARPAYWPGRVSIKEQGQVIVQALPWSGSADLLSLSAADGLIFFPAGNQEYAAGTQVAWLDWPDGSGANGPAGLLAGER